MKRLDARFRLQFLESELVSTPGSKYNLSFHIIFSYQGDESWSAGGGVWCENVIQLILSFLTRVFNRGQLEVVSRVKM